MLIYYVRHGAPDYPTDSLTPDGVLQADAVSKRLANCGIEEIYSSPMGRAIQTAEPTARALGLPINIEEWMSERLAGNNFRGTDGEKFAWAFFFKDKLIGHDYCYEDRDSFSHGYYIDDDVARRGAAELEAASDDFLLRMGFRRTGVGNSYETVRKNSKKIAIFAHEGFGLHWLARLTNIPYHIFTSTFTITHTGVTIIYFDENKKITYPQILVLSDSSHICKEGLPLKFREMDI